MNSNHKPHKITLIKGELNNQGGLEKYTWQLALDFCKKGVGVTLLTTGNPTPPFNSPLLDIVSLPVKRSLSYLSVVGFDKACHQYLNKHPTPIVFSLDRNRSQTHLRAGNGAHIAYLKRRSLEEGLTKRWSFSINPLHQSILSLEKKAFEDPLLKVLFTNSHGVKQEILQHYNTDPNKISVIHNGVEWEKWKTPFLEWESAKERFLSQFKLSRNAFQLLFVGHNFRRKGLEKLLHALSFLKNESFQLSVVGEDKNLSYFTVLSQRLRLGSKVFFFGKQASALPFYQCADALVIPSLYDPFANVTLEALAMGVFTLSSTHNGGHEILNSKNGAIIEDLSDVKAFATKISKMFLNPKTQESSQAIRDSVAHLDFSNQLDKMTKIVLQSSP